MLRRSSSEPFPFEKRPATDDETLTDPTDGAPMAPGDGDGDDVASIRARLAARGLVRTEPSPRIRELTGGPDLGAPRPVITPYKGNLERATASDRGRADDSVAGDPEHLEDEPFGPRAAVRCPSCHTAQSVAVDATGYRCGSCEKVWRWAVCSACSTLSLTIARQESWRCRCGAYSRSWWRTAISAREAVQVATRRRADAADRERQRVLAAARHRRWKVIAAGVVVVVLAGLSAMVFTSADAAGPAEATRATCARWGQLKSDLANGALDGGGIDQALADLADGAALALGDVGPAAEQLAKAGRPGDADFLIATTLMSDACEAAR